MSGNVYDIAQHPSAARRLDQHAWRKLVLMQFSDEEREQFGDARLVEAAAEARGQVEGISALQQILTQSEAPYPEDVGFTPDQRLVVETARQAHLDAWSTMACRTAIRLAVKGCFEG